MSRTRGEGDVPLDRSQADCSRSAGVTLLSAGLDEVPMAYKDIESVMAAQSDLVEPIARFDPRDREDGRRR